MCGFPASRYSVGDCAVIAHMEDLSWERIGERVRASRAAAGLSQQALADAVGLERSMVSKLESGDRRIDAVELTRIARAVGVPVSHFPNPLPEVVSRRAAIAGSEEVGDSGAARSAYATEVRLSEWLRAVSAPGDEVRRLRARTPTDAEFRDAVEWKPQPDLSSVLVPPRYSSAVVAALEARAITPARAVETLRGQVSAEQLTGEAAE
ncbi:helix-turn-helix domain-containing protein [Streptomonospora sp. NEAU-YY374]|nr:helix-turn-helix domain-containing protein [Streptomonospora nanhaiensis]MBX9387052.1 helix-turn-helix domain-containing protein [Streptomonospora nanhaiensis]